METPQKSTQKGTTTRRLDLWQGDSTPGKSWVLPGHERITVSEGSMKPSIKSYKNVSNSEIPYGKS